VKCGRSLTSLSSHYLLKLCLSSLILLQFDQIPGVKKADLDSSFWKNTFAYSKAAAPAAPAPAAPAAAAAAAKAAAKAAAAKGTAARLVQIAETAELKADEADNDIPTEFEISEKVFVTGVTTSEVILEGIPYLLRHPRSPEVIEDWKKLLFTKEEVEFLNALQLNPSKLNEIYTKRKEDTGVPINWIQELADNMAIIVRSKCFKEPGMVLHADCQKSEAFIYKVLEYYANNEERMRSLKDDEEDANNRALLLRIEKDAVKISKLKDQVTDRTGWDLDPFNTTWLRKKANKPVEDLLLETFIFNTVYRPSFKEFKRDVLIIDKKDNYSKWACELYIKEGDGKNEAKTLSDADSKLTEKYEILQKKGAYPGYAFLP